MSTSTTTTTLFAEIHVPTTTTSTTITVKGEEQTSLPKNKLSFLSLPPEVRNQIYTYLFTDSKLSLSTIHPSNNLPLCTSLGRCLGSPCGSFCTCLFPYGITSVSRLVRSETRCLLPCATTLEVSSRIEKTLLLPEEFLGLVERVVLLDAKALGLPVGTKRGVISSTEDGGRQGMFEMEKLKGLKVLEVRNISVWCQYHRNSYLDTEAADECMFNLAMFNLRRVSPGLSRVCEDLDRGFRVLLWCQFVGNSRTGDTVHAVIDVDTRSVLQKTRGATIRSRNEWAGFY